MVSSHHPAMRNQTIRRVEKQRVPCAEVSGGAKLQIHRDVDPARAGWQLVFEGYGKAIVFNALPLTFNVGGKLVAQVIAIRADGDDWHGLVVPEPAPKTPEEADERWPGAGVGDVMRQTERMTKAMAASRGPSAVPTPAVPRVLNRKGRRAHAARTRRSA